MTPYRNTWLHAFSTPCDKTWETEMKLFCLVENNIHEIIIKQTKETLDRFVRTAVFPVSTTIQEVVNDKQDAD